MLQLVPSKRNCPKSNRPQKKCIASWSWFGGPFQGYRSKRILQLEPTSTGKAWLKPCAVDFCRTKKNFQYEPRCTCTASVGLMQPFLYSRFLPQTRASFHGAQNGFQPQEEKQKPFKLFDPKSGGFDAKSLASGHRHFQSRSGCSDWDQHHEVHLLRHWCCAKLAWGELISSPSSAPSFSGHHTEDRWVNEPVLGNPACFRFAENLSTLRSEAGILLTISSHEDNADVGLVPWRVAYYIVGTFDDLQNGINLIESFFAWRKDNVSDSEKPFAKNLRLEIHATKPLADHLKSSSFTLPATLASPHSLCPFEASPPSGTRSLLFSAEFDSDGWRMSGVFLGATFQFRDRFEAQEIYGARDPDSDAYFRVLSKTNVGNEKGRVWFLNTVLTTVLRDLAMMVKLTTPPPEGSPAQEFLNLLLDQPQVSIRNSTWDMASLKNLKQSMACLRHSHKMPWSKLLSILKGLQSGKAVWDTAFCAGIPEDSRLFGGPRKKVLLSSNSQHGFACNMLLDRSMP